MTDNEVRDALQAQVNALQAQVDALQALFEDMLTFSIALARSDRRRYLNQANGQDASIQYLSNKLKGQKTAMTDKTGHGSHGKGEL